jgi:DNA-binding MarR family transcriptional regulator
MDDRAKTALIALRRILRATEQNSRKVVHDAGLTPSQLLVLQILARARRAVVGEIAKAVTLSQATVSSLVDKLAARGLVRRQRGENDRRLVWVEITEAGDAVLGRAPDLLQDIFRTRFASLPDWEQAYIVGALERVTALLDAGDLDAAPILDVGAIDRSTARGPTAGDGPTERRAASGRDP